MILTAATLTSSTQLAAQRVGDSNPTLPSLLLCPWARHLTLDCSQWMGSALHGSSPHWCFNG